MTERFDSYKYQSGITRRESLKWLGLLAAGSASVAVSKYSQAAELVTPSKTGHWPDLTLSPITAKGYGTDPNLIIPPSSPWPLTLTQKQLTLVAILADIIVPSEGSSPSATQVHVPDVIDEWVSAPYSGQQRDRVTILHALAWIDDEAQLRFKAKFVQLSSKQQLAIIDDIAYRNKQTPVQFQQIAKAFDRFRELILAAYFCSPAGMKDIGYMGNVAIAGDYPGPDDAAKQHLATVLEDLGLTEYAYKATSV
ncbi:gluconate 2-dehydrogenase subunit 3 family protein [Thalassotalea sp. G2M2-11]|uniref:gluconate 2-dehydrogenase subunit 3 family protein n=1 Tax=Thalassotalea sp. G2M2-11 TaxID=2787627 RepID=UPI0019CFCFB1|nr:gluconate 2-dehydrogenase subunit 3 family protein [Thalassotalea sp. G2M2-11]